jgi:hypothetical protein
MANKNEARIRIDLRVAPALRKRLEAAAERFGLKISAYIRLAVTERLERDEATEEQVKARRPKT